MKSCQFPAFLVLLVSVLILSVAPSVAQSDQSLDQNRHNNLDLELRQHRLLQRARDAGMMTQEWSKRAVAELLSHLSLPGGEAEQEAERVSMATGEARGEEEEPLRTELQRSVDPQNNLPPRDRKAGCKNFYWKGFTSC